MEKSVVQQRRAIEALRAGVPNRDVVRYLPFLQDDIHRRFGQILEGIARDNVSTKGMLISGDFGTGKSHCLEYFQHLAIEQGYICSRVVVSKETPLFDLLKVYRKCIETAKVKGKYGFALKEILLQYDKNSPRRDVIWEWIRQYPAFNPRLTASLFLFELHNDLDEEVTEGIINEWCGYPMKLSPFRTALREKGVFKEFPVAKPGKGLEYQLFMFISQLFTVAGYKGWLILIDEAELIGRYSTRQRARAYANLAFLLGLDKQRAIPRMGSVAAIVGDYSGKVLQGGKNDYTKIAKLTSATSMAPYVGLAQTGMEAILKDSYPLRPNTRELLEETYTQIRKIYSDAYDWGAPELKQGEWLLSQGMRRYIRTWINTWDIKRLFGEDADVTLTPITSTSYAEDQDLQTEAKEEE